MSICFSKAQTNSNFIENQIVKLVMRLDSLYHNIVYDTALNSATHQIRLSEDYLNYSFKREADIIKQGNMKLVDIDRSKIWKKIPVNIVKKFISTPKSKRIKNCVYNDKFFGLWMDSLSLLISKQSDNEKAYDSLTDIQILGTESVIAKLTTKRCNQILKNQFILYDVYNSI